MMLSLGCIQARRCNHNDCPTGVATQRPDLVVGLVVADKAPRVARFHDATVESFMHLIGAAGISHADDLKPWHVLRRMSSTEVRHYGELYEFLEPGSLLEEPLPSSFVHAWGVARPDAFSAA